jgi:hypothetical protein
MTLISPARSLTNATTLLQQVWGYPSFRNNQAAIVQTLIQGRDAMVVMPTGGGKSLCFQLPALVRSGLTIVISPLLALMENQVQDLKKRGINAACLHSQQARPEYKQILHDLTQHRLKLLYVSPETLLSPPVWQRLLDPRLTIGLLVLDEAHCLTAWGDSFRPAYFRLGPIRQALLKAKPPGIHFPVAAFTATADPETQQAITQILQLKNPVSFCDEPYRPNLQLKIQRTYTRRDRRYVQPARKLRKGDPLDDKDKAFNQKALVSTLKQIHDELDVAVFEAYGWEDLIGRSPLAPLQKGGTGDGSEVPLLKGDLGGSLSQSVDDQILDRLVKLNAQRAEEERNGHIRWLRPEYQAPDQIKSTQTTLEGITPIETSIPTPASQHKWPKDFKDQLAAIRDLLRTQGGEWSVEAIAAQFKNASRSKPKIQAALEALETLGLVTQHNETTQTTWYFTELQKAG